MALVRFPLPQPACPNSASRNPAPPRAVGMTMQTSLEKRKAVMNSIIYLVGLVVVVLFILSLLGLR